MCNLSGDSEKERAVSEKTNPMITAIINVLLMSNTMGTRFVPASL
jgi:hypothetical protein